MNDFIDQRKKMLEAFKKEYRGHVPPKNTIDIPKNLFVTCEDCNELLLVDDLNKNLKVCPKCGYHFRISARERLHHLDVNHTFKEFDTTLTSTNPLNFPGYQEKLTQYQASSHELDAVITGSMELASIPIALGIMDSTFMMGSMGSVVGEKLTRLMEYATNHRLPLIIFCASGGARMQEGMFSLMQMAKTASSLSRHSEAGLLSVMILTNPTTGGVAASFATLGDLIFGEQKALIGFAGPRVIKETIREDLPKDFQKAEFLLQKGFLDGVYARSQWPSILAQILHLHEVMPYE